ncbi:hypothetical protein OG21DRAFT_1491940 [Imleria badia]|nr:hypothetical protein OG21DRAFT_1491940 [Imleria badia]
MSSKDRLSRSALQRIAANYFDTTSPWSEVTDRGRFGIPAFVTDFSVLLVNHIKKVIPQLRQDVERLLASCLEEISSLPKPLEADPQIEVLVRVNAFCDAFKGVVSGASSDKGLAQRNRALYSIFARDIRGTSPDFRPFEDPAQYVSIYMVDSEEGAEVRNDRVKIMGVYDVRKTIKESIAWELPGNIPYAAKTRLINQFTDLWSTPAEECLTSINDVLDEIVQQLTKTHFGRFRVLQDMISDLIRPDIEEHKNRALAAVKETLGLEITPIYTQNEKDFENLREKWLAKYRKARRNPGEYRIRPVVPPTSTAQIYVSRAMDREVAPSPESQALIYLAQAGYRGLTVDDLSRLLPRDQHFEGELIVMADVRA